MAEWRTVQARNSSGSRSANSSENCADVVEVHSVVQRQVPTVETAQKTANATLLQFIDKLVIAVVVAQKQILAVHTFQQTTEMSQILYMEKVVDVPVVQLAQVPLCRSRRKQPGSWKLVCVKWVRKS